MLLLTKLKLTISRKKVVLDVFLRYSRELLLQTKMLLSFQEAMILTTQQSMELLMEQLYTSTTWLIFLVLKSYRLEKD